MRISDWSSDVCSSDLVKPLHQGAQADVAGAREAAHGLLLRGVIVEEAAISGYRFLVVELGPQSDPHAGRVLQAARRLGHFPAGELLEVAVIEFQAGEERHQDVLRLRSEEHTSELQSLMRISYAVFCLKKT